MLICLSEIGFLAHAQKKEQQAALIVINAVCCMYVIFARVYLRVLTFSQEIERVMIDLWLFCPKRDPATLQN